VHRIARVVLCLGTLVTVLGFGKVHAAYVGGYDFTSSFRFAWSLAFAGALGLAAYGAGLPDLVHGSRRALGAALAATGLAAVAVSLMQLVVGAGLLPRFVVFSSAAVLVPFYALCSLISTGGRERQEERERVVVVSGEDEALALMREITESPERAATVVWVVRPDGEESLLEAATNTRATVIVLDRAAQADEHVVAQAAQLHGRGVRVRTLSGFYEEWLGKLPIAELESMSLMFDIQELHSRRYARIKRLMDFSAGLVGTAALVVVIPLVALANLAGGRGPLFYRQPRVGKQGRVFSILKFRTMRPHDGLSEWTTEDDPRITPVGHWLRRTHLDELPQAINMLRGDLSLVGPRPEQPHYVEDLLEKIPFYGLRHNVRPGLTGWAQVKYPYGASILDANEKLQFEFFYLRRQSLALDLRILVRTLRTVLGRAGR
jgi:lipopolysaccharide/colanic/teichoic acid biosynthesis glycosyltransferase